MKKKLFFIIRFSVINNSKSGSRSALSSKDIFEYKDKLMDVERLKNRLDIFRNITLRSLMQQECSDVDKHLVVLVSDQLPSAIQKEMYGMLEDLNRAGTWCSKMIYVASGLKSVISGVVPEKNINAAIEKYLHENAQESCFATIRLDDDDAISKNYSNLIAEKVLPDYSGQIITFPYGFQAVYDKEKKEYFDCRYLHYSKIALGLAHVNVMTNGNFQDSRKHVYALGNHTSLDVENSIISDSREKVFIRTITGINDSGSVPFHKYLPEVYSDDPSLENFINFTGGGGLIKSLSGYEELDLSERHKLMIRSTKDYAVNRMNRNK